MLPQAVVSEDLGIGSDWVAAGELLRRRAEARPTKTHLDTAGGVGFSPPLIAQTADLRDL
jgi:hypothetical protein